MREPTRFERWLVKILGQMACEHKKIMPNGHCWYCNKKVRRGLQYAKKSFCKKSGERIQGS